MTSDLKRLLDRGRLLHRLGSGSAPRCDRVWPLPRGGWLARIRSDDGFWGVAKPSGAWPKPLSRLFEAGQSTWLLELEALAWRIDHDPAVGQATERSLEPYSSRADVAKFRRLSGRLVGYKPLRRAVVRFDDPGGTPKAFAKYLRRRQAAPLAELHTVLGGWTEVNGAFQVPRVIDLRVDPDVVVLQPCSGVMLSNALFAPGSDPPLQLIDRIGRVIAGLHLCPKRSLPVHDRRRELRVLRSWLGVGLELVDEPASLEAAFDTLVEYERRLTDHPGVLSHRDLHDGQLLVDDDVVTVLDVDTLAIAEPELDLGNLLAHLDWNGLNRGDGRWRVLARPLVEAYCEVVARSVDWDRLHWYRAAAALRLACVHAGRSDSREHAPMLTDWAHRQVGRLDNRSRRAV